ncbi:PREDICTED: Fanconi anemia group J protein homolog [Ceratosolen solmsi marchali]|uniref:DNA 5'-3' helicase n=1 Tax=Ceratosolen solmsi marchali TaxID=326594 RepID=A0AAJ6YRX0_9HYME|nr:PREDICTED: Fanconi anemia group J protein homolog [Ceratosolen solmsi marchali]
MIFIACFTVLFVCVFYSHKHLKSAINKLGLNNRRLTAFEKDKSINTEEMSDEEFRDPLAATNHWNKTKAKRKFVPDKASVFRWNKTAKVSEKIENDTKTPKTIESSIEISNDESEVNVSDDSAIKESPCKNNFINNDLSVNDSSLEQSTSINNRNFQLEKQIDKVKSFKKYEKNYNNIPLPAGMPPIIAGVPVMFPITPYKSQISVMNAVIKGCKNNENCLLESPTGSGKTLALLCAALAWQAHFVKAASTSRTVVRIRSNEGQPSHARDLPRRTERLSELTYIICAAGCDFLQHRRRMHMAVIIKNAMLNAHYTLSEYITSLQDDKNPKENVKLRIPRIFYSSRTHKQIEQVIREFKKTAYAHIPMTVLSSREHSCIQSFSKGISKTQLCNDLLDPRNKGECIYYNNKHKIGTHTELSQHGFETPWDIEDLVELGREKKACPYFAAKSLMLDSHIIFSDILLIVSHYRFNQMQINLTGDVVIIDEGHNIEDICREIGSYIFREDHLNEAIKDCNTVYRARPNKAYDSISQYLTTLNTLISDQDLQSPINPYEETTSTFWNGEETWMLFNTYKLADDAYSEFISDSEQAISDYRAMKEDMKLPSRKKDNVAITTINFATVKLLEQLKDALNYVKSPESNMSYRCTISQAHHQESKVSDGLWTRVKDGKRLRSLKFMCMNAAVVFDKLRKGTRCLILASGTLSPTTSFEGELGTRFLHKVHANHVIAKDQVYVRAIPRGPTGVKLRATYQNIQTLPFKDDLGKLIGEVCQCIPHGILCFFSSYSALRSNVERWQDTDQWEDFFRCKRVFVEPRQHHELEETMGEYREAVDSGGALLLAVFRGKVAEGIDFSDNFARCVITIGIPFAVQNDPEVKLKREYNDVNQDKGLLLGREWYTVQAYRALNQALGRCIRHKNDWGAILLVDERLQSKESDSYLSKWIREMKRHASDYNLREELQDFVKRQRMLENENP